MKRSERESARATVKKPYSSPKLTKYGTVAKLTQGVGSANGDGGHAMMS